MREPTLVVPGVLDPSLLEIFADDVDAVEVLLAAPGLLPAGFAGLVGIAREPGRRLPSATDFAYRAAILEEFARALDRLPQVHDWEERLVRWMDAIASGRARFFHRTGTPLYTRLVSRNGESIVTSAPICAACLDAADELPLSLRGAEHARARQWFHAQREKAADIGNELLAFMRSSWAGDLPDPEDLYYRVLATYFSATIEGLDQDVDDNPMLRHLTQFQAEAYQYAKGILRRHGGVFLADVVGLGKTFIALALLRHLQNRYGEHAVVVAPPNVCPAWLDLAGEFRVELEAVSIGKLDDLHRLGSRDILVVDESHRFRNRSTLRYETLADWLRPQGEASSRKVILVSATPQNTRAADLRTQLELFPDNFSRLPFRGESLDAWFHEVERGSARVTELLQHVVVRRTRGFIKSSYPDATIRVYAAPGRYVEAPLVFPQRVSGPEQCLRYSIQETYGGALYDEVLAILQRLHLPLYRLGEYVRHESTRDPRVRDLGRSGNTLRGLYRVLVLKRLESSVFAFRTTIERMCSRLLDALRLLERGEVRARLPRRSGGNDADDAVEVAVRDAAVLPARLFDEAALREDLERDLRSVERLLRDVAELAVVEDAKLQRLLSHLRDRPPSRHRTIVFTQFADTARYLFDAVRGEHPTAEVATGSSRNLLGLARRFAPIANRCADEVSEPIDLMISTDALSEGVNLQDADTLIHYDLHWNPVRLIQRAGRIDRLGSQYESIHVYSFLPERELEAHLGIEAVVRERIREFTEVFGEDSNVLPAEDRLEMPAVLDSYTGEALRRADDADDADEMDGLCRHAERLLRLRREQPDRFARIVALRPALRAASRSSAPPVAACRMGWFWGFFSRGPTGALEGLDDFAGLERFYRLAKEGRPDENETRRTIRRLGDITDAAREAFAHIAQTFRLQREAPQLTPQEEFLLQSLEEYRSRCLSTQRDLLDDLVRWIKQGHSKVQLTRLASAWKGEGLSAEAVFHELRPLYARFPPFDEALGDQEVAGTLLGASWKGHEGASD